MWYQSLRSRSSGSERNEQMIVSHRRAAPPINPSLGHFLLGNIANAGLDYSSSNFKDQQDHGTENPNLSSTTRRLPASRVFPHLPNGPGRIRSQARSCISACHGQLLHPTPPPRRPCDQHRLTTGRGCCCFSERTNTLRKCGMSTVRRCTLAIIRRLWVTE